MKVAVDLFEELAATNPSLYEPRLGGLLSNFASRLAQSGKHAEALKFASRAVEIRKTLAEENPNAYLREYALGLHTLVNCLTVAGKVLDAREYALKTALCLKEPQLQNGPDWAQQVAALAAEFSEQTDLAANGILGELLTLMILRTDTLARDSFQHELDALQDFCAHYVALVFRFWATAIPYGPNFPLGNLIAIAETLQSRDLRELLQAADRQVEGDNSTAGVRQRIVETTIERDTLVARGSRLKRSNRGDIDKAVDSFNDKLTELRASLRVKMQEEFGSLGIAQAPNVIAPAKLQSLLSLITSAGVNASGSGLLCLLDLPAEIGRSVIALWVRLHDLSAVVLHLPQLFAVAEAMDEYELSVFESRAVRSSEVELSARHDTDQAAAIHSELQDLLVRFRDALFGPMLAAGVDLSKHHMIVCTHGVTHALPFGALKLIEGALQQTCILQYPGLPFALAAVERTGDSCANSSIQDWVLLGDGGQENDGLIPGALLESQINRGILLRNSSARVEAPGGASELADILRTRDHVDLIAMCHGRQASPHDAELNIGSEHLRAVDVLKWRRAPRAALLQSCMLGRSRDDHRGNSMGMVSALMIRGSDVVIAFSKPLVDGIAPWISSLILWNLIQSRDIREAAELTRLHVATQSWPAEYQLAIREIVLNTLHSMLAVAARTSKSTDTSHFELINPPAIDLLRMARDWPWVGHEAVQQLASASNDETPELVAHVVNGLFFLRQDCLSEFEKLMVEQVAFMHVFGAAAGHA